MALFESTDLNSQEILELTYLAADAYTDSSGVSGWTALDAGGLSFVGASRRAPDFMHHSIYQTQPAL